MRRAARKDRNHREIVAMLERMGAVVVDVSGTACGTDLFVWTRAAGWHPQEVKDGAKPPSARKLTSTEKDLERRCKAAGAPHHVVNGIADSLEAAGLVPFDCPMPAELREMGERLAREPVRARATASGKAQQGT